MAAVFGQERTLRSKEDSNYGFGENQHFSDRGKK